VTARRRDALLGALGVAVLLAAWEGAARSGTVSPAVFPAPSAAVAGTLARLPPAEIGANVLISLTRIVEGFALGAALGIAVAVAAGWYRTLGNLLRPVIELLRPIPPLAWIPMAIVWFGLGESSKVFVIFLGAFFPVLTNAWKGIAGIDPVLIRAAQTMDQRGLRLLARVVLPAAMPDIATGLRVGWGLSFGVLVAAELIAASSGMGFMIMNARQFGEVGVIIFGILLIGACNLATDWLLAAAIRRWLGRWHAV
jgi:ABC-type nitrate/sulfonate/bicarbonate transport system permease component